jgi:hypothetical protein
MILPGTERLSKGVRMPGAPVADVEAYELYAAGKPEEGSAADGPFPTAIITKGGVRS